MLCEVCKKRIAVLTQEIDRGYGKVRLAVCNDCAQNREQKEMQMDYINDFWGAPQKLTTCGVCGTTMESILKTGYVGCATCYKIFASEIGELVHSIQGKNTHVGKVPLSEQDRAEKESDSAFMMDRALASDDFNLADIVRNHFPGKRR